MRLADIPDDCPLPRDTPYGMVCVSITQFSVARYYGGCDYKGRRYIYLPMSDELIRWDVMDWLAKQARDQRKAEREAARQESLL